jgi:hypothetical protein
MLAGLMGFFSNKDVVQATNPLPITGSFISGSIRCGSLYGWGSGRYTSNVNTPRTIYFEPARSGTHKISFDGYRTQMTPYWSNDGGKTWHPWNWNNNHNYYTSEWPRSSTVKLWTGSRNIIYKFVFYSHVPQSVYYKFYCGK